MKGMSAGTCRIGSPRASPADSTPSGTRSKLVPASKPRATTPTADNRATYSYCSSLVGPYFQAGGHDKFAARQVWRGIRKLDGVCPADHPVGILASGRQRLARRGPLLGQPSWRSHAVSTFDEQKWAVSVSAISRPHQRGQAGPEQADQQTRHVSRPLSSQQAQEHSRGTALHPQLDSGPDVQGRRPRHAVVVLLGRRRRAADRETGHHRGNQSYPAGAGAGARGGHAGQCVRVVGTATCHLGP